MESREIGRSHRRLNPISGEWVLVCPHRLCRPWSGQQEPIEENDLQEFNTNNPLCPGAVRSNGLKNPDYKKTFVFTNDFPALLDSTEASGLLDASADPLFQTTTANGTCRVMCFHPKSNQSLPLMSLAEIKCIIEEWINQFIELSSKYTWIQIFENKGLTMGCSNPHPHCQIWACSYLPSQPTVADMNLRKYYDRYQKPMLEDYISKEIKQKKRIVLENCDWLVVVPFWAKWPFETMIISRQGNKRLNDLTMQQCENLAVVIKQLTTKYDNLFECSFPYTMGFHGAPTGDMYNNDNKHWTLYAIYYPPLLRSASVRKFMVGFEMLCEAQRDLTPENAAERLRQINGNEHYTKRNR